MKVSRVEVILFWVIIGTSDQTRDRQQSHAMMDVGVVDCRFWNEPKQDIAKIIMENKIDSEGSVFYYWDTSRNECLPCTVCPERTLSLCWYVKDTQCISQREWIQRGLTNNNKFLPDLMTSLESDADYNDDTSDGVVVFRSHSEATNKEPAVFGVPVYTTDDSTQVRDSPTRMVHRKYSRNPPYHVIQTESEGMEEQEAYGTPTFFSKDDSVAETVHHNPLTTENRPILTILHEILNNKSHGLSVKDVANVTKSNSKHFKHNPVDISKYFNNDDKIKLEVTTTTTDRNPDIYKHTQYSMMEPSATSFLPLMSSSPASVTSSTNDGDNNLYEDESYEYHDKFKQIWPYRTDDKYSLFYFHPSKDEPSDGSKVYPWPSLSDSDEVYQDYQTRLSDKEDNLNRGGFSTIGSLVPTSKEGQNSNNEEENTKLLEKIFLGVTSLVLVLIIVLIYVTNKTRKTQNRFKLLDNSDNVSSYQSVSPAETILPPASSPSPLPSRRTSLISPTPSLRRSTPVPTPAATDGVYDRTKLSIPLQRYNIPSSSSSSSPVAKSPSNIDHNLIHPSVARSLRNIKQTANHDIQHIELDLNN